MFCEAWLDQAKILEALNMLKTIKKMSKVLLIYIGIFGPKVGSNKQFFSP